MRRTKTFRRRNRGGKVTNVAREHYLRDDIWCGCLGCTECGPYNESQPATIPQNAREILILDTNVVLSQMDLIEHASFAQGTNIILLQTVLAETKHRDDRLYKRLSANVLSKAGRHVYVFSNEHHRAAFAARKKDETANDYSDRCIRRAAAWYSKHLNEGADAPSVPVKVIMISNDVANRGFAVEEGIACTSIHQYVKEKLAIAHPQLLDMLATLSVSDNKKKNSSDVNFSPYWAEERLRQGVANGSLFTGKVNIGRGGGYEKVGRINNDKFDRPVRLVGSHNLNRTIDGDQVYAQLIDNDEDAMDVDGEKTQSPEARVVGIVKRNWREYAGCLEETDKQAGNVLFVPVDARVPKIRIQSRQIQQLMDKRIVVCIDDWRTDSRYPSGHYVRTLGQIGAKEVETAVLLLEHDVCTTPWSDNVLACLPPDGPIDRAEVKSDKRMDLRDWNIVSVDPPGCQDIDDALHCVQMENGNFDVGVHIADVAHYIEADCALDVEASKRGTSVYLVERRIDMLPKLLSTNLCSLVGQQERLAFSVRWEMTPDAKIVDTKFHRSVIKSKAAMAYSDAQERINGGTEEEPDKFQDQSDPITRDICNLNKLAQMLRKARFAGGALTLASPELKFVLNEEGDPTKFSKYVTYEAHAMVEEFMLLANTTVAKRILEFYPTHAMLRRHPSPKPSNFDPLIHACKIMGFDLDTRDSKTLGESLNKAQLPSFPYFNELIRIMTTRCMNQAVYFSSGDLEPPEFAHYGLASPIYTHFTSPIRRYADVVVHRLLANSLGLSALPDSIRDSSNVRSVAEVINHRHRMAQMASRASNELYTMIYFRDKRERAEAVVFEVRPSGFTVMVPKYGIEGRIMLVSKDDMDNDRNPWTFDAETSQLTRANPAPGVTFKLFDKVIVDIFVETTRMKRQRLVMQVVRDDVKPLARPPGSTTSAPALSSDQPVGTCSVARTAKSPTSSAPKKRRIVGGDHDNFVDPVFMNS